MSMVHIEGNPVRSIFNKMYCRSGYHFGRVRNTRWIALSYVLGPHIRLPYDNKVTLKIADQNDITKLQSHPDADEGVLKSVLNFWHLYGIHSLYLGYFDDDNEPATLQYVLDDLNNDVYRSMPYGKMYRINSTESVQVENIYVFRNKRIKNAANRFEYTLFNMLRHKGKKLVRTHISCGNKAAIIWASRIGFVPQYWINMLSINLPILRMLKPSFSCEPIRPYEWSKYPLIIFKERHKEDELRNEYTNTINAGT